MAAWASSAVLPRPSRMAVTYCSYTLSSRASICSRWGSVKLFSVNWFGAFLYLPTPSNCASTTSFRSHEARGQGARAIVGTAVDGGLGLLRGLAAPVADGGHVLLVHAVEQGLHLLAMGLGEALLRELVRRVLVLADAFELRLHAELQIARGPRPGRARHRRDRRRWRPGPPPRSCRARRGWRSRTARTRCRAGPPSARDGAR